MTVLAVDRKEMLARPHAVATFVETTLPLVAAKVVTCDYTLSVLELAFAPTLELEAHGFPVEVARVAQFRDERHGEPYAFPIGPTRNWFHRYPVDPDFGCFGQLCLWYPGDPPHLKWMWAKGILDFVRIVQRHLWFEEQYRRTGRWPAEDAPHSNAAGGRAHPIRTPALQASPR